MIRLLALALAVLVAWLSLTPKPPGLPGLMPNHEDLVAHGLMHLALAGALVSGWPGPGRVVLAFGLAVAFEVGQLAVPGRTFDLRDLLANLGGAAAGAGLAAFWLVPITPPRWR